MRILLQEILVVLLRQIELGLIGWRKIFLADLGDGQQRLFAQAGRRIVVNQIFISLDRALEIAGLELLAHAAIEIGDVLDRRGNFHRVGRDQVDAAVGRNQIFVIAHGALAFRLGFQCGPLRFGAFELILGRGPPRHDVILRSRRGNGDKGECNNQCEAKGQRKRSQSQSGQTKSSPPRYTPRQGRCKIEPDFWA